MKVSRKQSTPLSFGEFSKERSTSSSVCPIFLFPKSQNNASMGNFKSFQVTSGRSFDQVWKKTFAPSDSNGASHLHLLRIEPNIPSKPTRTVQLRGPCSPGTSRQKSARDWQMLQGSGSPERTFDPTRPQHWPDLAAVLASKATTSVQLGPSWLQLRPNLAARSRNLVQLEAIRDMASNLGTLPA